MTKFFLVANLSVTPSFLTTFFHSPVTRNSIDTHALRKGMVADVTRIFPTDVPVMDNAAMSKYKGTPFSEDRVFRERT